MAGAHASSEGQCPQCEQGCSEGGPARAHSVDERKGQGGDESSAEEGLGAAAVQLTVPRLSQQVTYDSVVEPIAL